MPETKSLAQILAENRAKREEAQKAASGQPNPTPPAPPVEGLQKAAPKPVPYKPIKDKTPEEKAKLQEEIAAEMAVRAKRQQKK